MIRWGEHGAPRRDPRTPVGKEPAPDRQFGVPGVPIGLDQPDYAGWLDSETYRRLIASRQWLRYYVRGELWEKDQRWTGVNLPDEYEESEDELIVRSKGLP